MEADVGAIRFGTFLFVPEQGLLLRSGDPVPVGRRAFDILHTLVARRPAVVSKDELMQAAWGTQLVEENTLAVHLSALRKALGDGRQGVRYIATVSGRGYQFIAPTEARDTPAVRTLETDPSGNLPRAEGSLLGREAELQRARVALRTARLLTLVGPGGIGKTRLALAVGEHAAADYPDGVWWVDLTPLREASAMVGTVARALRLRLGTGDALAQLRTSLAGSRRLLILDNCEHVAAGAAELAGALQDVEGLRLLATSLEPLGVASEQVDRLDPLALPAESASVAEALDSPAVGLFLAKAQAVASDFRLDEDNVAAVVGICRRVEGVPLALELTAVRAAFLGAGPVAQRLGERLLELSSGRRDVVPKHQTLRALMAWSYGLLSPPERTVLRRLAVFAGGWTLDAAEGVVADAAVPEWRVAEHLASLIGKSLVIAQRTARGVTYRLLETTRLFAADQLQASGESGVFADRHAQYYAVLFDQAQAVWETTPDTEWLRHWAPELDNVRAALDHALTDPALAEVAVRLAGTAGLLWQHLGLPVEGMRYVDRAMERIDENAAPSPAARLLARAAALHGNYDRLRALPLAERAMALYRRLGDKPNLASVLGMLSSIQTNLGYRERAEAMLQEAHRLLAGSNRKKSLSALLNNMAILCFVSHRDLPKARDYCAQAVALARELRNHQDEITYLINLADSEFCLGAAEDAIGHVQEAIAASRHFGRRDTLGMASVNLIYYLIARDRPAEARPVAEEALALLQHSGGLFLRICLELWALLGALEGRHGASALLRGYVNAGFAASGEIREPVDQEIYDRLAGALATAMPAVEIEASAAEGAQWTEQQAVAFAIRHLVAPDSSLTSLWRALPPS